jgi:hypothetical protein
MDEKTQIDNDCLNGTPKTMEIKNTKMLAAMKMKGLILGHSMLILNTHPLLNEH